MAAAAAHPHFRGVTAMDLGLDASGYDGVLGDAELHLAHHHDPHQDPHTQAHAHHHQQQQHPQTHPQPHPHPHALQQQQQPHHGGQFGILAPNPLPQEAESALFRAHGQSIDQSHPAQPAAVAALAGERQSNNKLSSMLVVDPPDLAAWRAKLFDVNETIVLTNEEFETYFPHVDNVYSHRSTQKYKRKPFVSHYWDCRMKGRPPGTPKSDDPTKKKRKRNARARDLCDVKIKITEYSPGAQIELEGEDSTGEGAAAGGGASGTMIVQPGQKFWTIQRVNGNGGNGKADGVAGPHKHTLARSDEIKKNSIQRYLAQQEKESKKLQASIAD